MIALAAFLAQAITAANAGQVKETVVLPGNKMAVFGLAFSPDGKSVAAAGIDRSIRVWDAGTGKQTSFFEHKRQAIAVAFSPDGGTLVSAGYEPAVRLWDLKTQKQIEEQKENPKDKLQVLQIGTVFVEFNPGGGMLAYVTDGGSSLYLWDAKARTQREFDGSPAFEDRFGRMAWSADGLWLACQIENHKTKHSEVRLFSVQANKWTATLTPPDKGLVAGEGIAIAADGSKVASVDLNTSIIHVWDVKSGKEGPVLRGHQHDDNNPIMISQLAFNPDAGVLASVSYDKTVRLWEVATGKELASLPSHKNGAAAVAFSRDGTRIASADLDGTVQLWGVK
jgi:WD40 repeat protein